MDNTPIEISSPLSDAPADNTPLNIDLSSFKKSTATNNTPIPIDPSKLTPKKESTTSYANNESVLALYDGLDDHVLGSYTAAELKHSDDLNIAAAAMQEKLQKLIASGTASDATLNTFRDLYKKRIQNILNYNKTLQARYSNMHGDVRGYKPEITSDPILTPDELADINANVQFADESGTIHESVGVYNRQASRAYTLSQLRALQASADESNADTELGRNIPEGFQVHTHAQQWDDQISRSVTGGVSKRLAIYAELGSRAPRRSPKNPYSDLVVIPSDPGMQGTSFSIQRTSSGHVLSPSELKESTEAFTAASSNMDLYSPDVNNWSEPGVRYQFGVFNDDPEFRTRGVLAYASNIGSVVKVHTDRVSVHSVDFTHQHTNGDKELEHHFAAEEAMKNGDVSMLQYVMFHETGHILEYKRVPISSWYRYMKGRKPARRWAQYKADFGGNTPISEYSKDSEAEHIAEAIAKYLATGQASPQFRDFMIKYAIANGGQDFIQLPKPASTK